MAGINVFILKTRNEKPLTALRNNLLDTQCQGYARKLSSQLKNNLGRQRKVLGIFYINGVAFIDLGY